MAFAAPVHATLPSPEETCSARKLRAVVNSFRCQIKVQARLLLDRTADAAKCDAKVTTGFANAEAAGGCIVEDDGAATALAVQQAAADVFDALGADPGLTTGQKRCVLAKANAIARHADCQSKALLRRVLRVADGSPADFTDCAAGLQDKFSRIETAGACLVVGDVETVRDSSGSGYGYLAGAVLWYRDFSSALLPRADLSHASMYEVGFVSVVLSNANLRSANMERAAIETADFHAADFTNAELGGADIVGTDLRDATFAGADLFGVWISTSNLAGADLGTARLDQMRATSLDECPAVLPTDWVCRYDTLIGPKANLYEISLAGADLSGLQLQEAAITNANLAGANLSGSDLTDANCSGTTFAGAVLSNADLTGAYLRFSNFGNADVTGAVLTGVDWLNAICPDGTVALAGVSCCGHHVGGAPAACSP